MANQVAAANFRTKLDAEIAGGLLDAAKIPYILQSTEGMLHGPIAPGATILVSREMEERARQVLTDAGILGSDDH